ncbi:unnamed protein product [Brassica rapa subsp. narinosa]
MYNETLSICDLEDLNHSRSHELQHSLMASLPASSLSKTLRYHVFPSFHGPDVRKTFLSHVRKQFNNSGIMMFDDQGIERSQTLAPSLTQAIINSRISIVVLSKNYASSSWCLDELVKILECKRVNGQTVMTIFYGVDPSDVRKQAGNFGRAFNDTCVGKTDEERQRWTQALTDVSNILGEHFLNWDNESNLIEKVTRDVSHKLNVSQSRDFEGMVGLGVHITEINSLLFLEDNGVRMVGICGHAGIGKTTIARALHSLLSSTFQLSCFVENVRGSHHTGLDEYGLKLCLQELLLSKILNQSGTRIFQLGAIKERLCHQKVLIIIDDVDHLEQLEALANDTTWFGPGSRIIVTTEDQELLKQHGINDTYHVNFPSDEEALEIFCRYAFRQSSPFNGFKKFAGRITRLCGNLPLGLRVVGSSLRGKSEDEWEVVTQRLETSLDRDIERVLRVGFESLHEKDQALFLQIAFFFNYKDDNHVKVMLDDSNFNVSHGLKTLVNKSLIFISIKGKIVMHKLLQQLGRQAIHRQDPWKRYILIDAPEISDVLENDTGTRSVTGISFDISRLSNDVFISEGAFKRMKNLQFLNVYNTTFHGTKSLHIPKDMEFPRRLRSLRWEAYPRKSLPPEFHPEYLVELIMRESQLQKLWEGTQPLTNLKKMDLEGSCHLKELPDLSKATNLERLVLNDCESLIELPSSFSSLHKLRVLKMVYCVKLQVVPNLNLASLEMVDMDGCSGLRSFPDISRNITTLVIAYTSVEELSASSIRLLSRLCHLDISGSRNLKTLTHVPESVTHLDLSYTSIEMIPDCIKCLHGLQHLYLAGCRKLRSLPELPISLMTVLAEGCESLVAVSCFLDTPNAQLNLSSCFKLSREARRAIIQQRFLRGWGCLPGRKIPAEFSHRGKGDHLVIGTEGKSPFSVSSGFQVCLVISPNQHTGEGMFPELLCHRIGRSGWPVENLHVYYIPTFRTEHMFIFQSELLDKDRCLDVDNEILFQFSCEFHDIIECGIRINADEAVKSSGEDDDCSYEYEHSEASECTEKYDTTFGLTCDKVSKEEEDNARGNNHTDCWNWIVLCFDISDILRNFGRLVWERVQPNHDAFKTKDKIDDEEEATDQSNVLDDFTI